MSEVERGYALYRAEILSPVKMIPPKLKQGMTANEAFIEIATSCIVHLQSNQNGLLQGQDPEYLHQMRIALRRLRAAQHLFFGKLLQTASSNIVDDLKWLAKQLGHARDWDVFMTKTLPLLMTKFPEENGFTVLQRQALRCQQHYNKIACVAIHSRRYAKLLASIGAWLVQNDHLASRSDMNQQELAPLDKLARRTLCKLDNNLRKRVQHLKKLSIDELHAVRISTKKLRYATEFFVELYPRKRSQHYLNSLIKLQDMMGDINDAATTKCLLKSLLTPKSTIAYRRLIEMTITWINSCEKQLLVNIKPKWNRFLSQKLFWKKEK